MDEAPNPEVPIVERADRGAHCWKATSGLARGFALFLGGFTLLNLPSTLRFPHFDGNLWWIDLRALPAAGAVSLEGALGMILLAFAVWPRMGPIRRRTTLALVGLFTALAAVNALVFWRLLAGGIIQNPHGISLSLVAVLGLGLIFLVAQIPQPHPPAQLWMLVTFGLCCLLFPVLQVFCFGKTDYRRPAQVAVVPGARVYADGRLSDAVADRVRTASQLYREGWVHRLVLSGGPGDGDILETEAMRRYAMVLGVPAEFIALDRLGLNTAATVRNTIPGLKAQRVLVVSEFYHLPRLKLAYAQAGVEVYTVPAKPVHWLRAWPLNSIVREIPAFWSYWLRGEVSSFHREGDTWGSIG